MAMTISGDAEMIRIAGEFVEELRRVTEAALQEQDTRIREQEARNQANTSALLLLVDLLTHKGLLSREFIDTNVASRTQAMHDAQVWSENFTEMVEIMMRYALGVQDDANVPPSPKLSVIDGGKSD